MTTLCAIIVEFPVTGLYFLLNGKVYLPGVSVNISDIGPQPDNRIDPGSTLVCVTTNVNKACCTGQNAVGEWFYPDGNIVPHARNSSRVVDFARYGFNEQIRLGRAISNSAPPLGVYTCQIPASMTMALHNATIIIQNGNFDSEFKANFLVLL